ncbi:MAG: hypothetical protein EXR51_04590 [Dehalococcoidia bacterium]|nr:hypothetical protein [Dehalococcoidia bacterium]
MYQGQRLNKLIHLLETGAVAFGAVDIPNGNYDDLEFVADAGFDFVMVEMEHEGFDLPSLRHSMLYLMNRRRIVTSGRVAQRGHLLRRRLPQGARQFRAGLPGRAYRTGSIRQCEHPDPEVDPTAQRRSFQL